MKLKLIILSEEFNEFFNMKIGFEFDLLFRRDSIVDVVVV